jgi:starch-binding outer membrane protein, SusD/RagB family
MAFGVYYILISADTYRELGKVNFSATDLLRFSPNPQQAAEGRFLRAFATFSILDCWDQVPYRENTNDDNEVPKVRKGVVAADYVISELNAIVTDLPVGPANRANKDAARALLMKTYLNKGVFTNRATPTFAAADMNQVITLANQIIASPRNYSLTANYFGNFTPTNDATSPENIFTAENVGGSSSGNVRSRWFCTLHYNQGPGGWNGFTTLSDFYDKFDATDKRKGDSFPGLTNVNGMRMGFLIGQQKDQNGTNLSDRNGAPLSYTREVKTIEIGNNLEVTGIRVIKYVPDLTGGDNSNNDYVYFRLADVLLMKAEALLRGGTDPNGQTALQLVNLVRARAGASAFASIDLDKLLEERGRELYWEGWRRQDLIRFGKFLGAWQEKKVSEPKRLLYPIPSRSLAANPNLVQNPGY